MAACVRARARGLLGVRLKNGMSFLIRLRGKILGYIQTGGLGVLDSRPAGYAMICFRTRVSE